MKTGMALTALVTAVGIAGCTPQLTPPEDGPIRVVASTNVYGSIATTIGGDRVEVTSIIDDPSQDPHSFEADARVQLALAKAHIVIENGGGYDPFIDRLLASLDTSNRAVISAIEVSPLELPDVDDTDVDHAGTDRDAHDHAEFNEHVWFDFATISAVAAEVRDALIALDPENAAEYTAQAHALQYELEGLSERTASLRPGTPVGVAVTEPLSLYLLDAMGLRNVTPAAFSSAIEQGSEVSAATLNETLRLFANGEASILIYNDQTTSPETEALKVEAEKAGAPIVPVSEIIPAGNGNGNDYMSWMSGILDDLEAALETTQEVTQ